MPTPARRTALAAVTAVALACGVTSVASLAPAAAVTLPPTSSDFDNDGAEDTALEARDGVTGASVLAVRYGRTGTTDVVRPPTGSTWWSSPLILDDSLATGDFDGDGYDDVAAADAGRGGDEAGGVWVFWGSAQGLRGPRAPRYIDQETAGVPGVSEPQDYFGSALAAGDVTGDGRSDLVIGARGEDLGTATDAGVALLLPGAAGGFAATAASFHQDTPGIGGAAEPGDEFGAAVAVGDVTGDGRRDVVLSALGENGTGMVHLLPGTAGGLTTTGSSGITAAGLGSRGGNDYFGGSLAVGDVTGDRKGEVVVGAAYGFLRTGPWCGFVAVIRGAATLSATGARLIDEDSPGMTGVCEDFDSFGWRVAAGDLTGDGLAEVVVGSRGEAIGSMWDAGYYTVLRGSTAGVTTTGSFAVSQDTAYVPGAAEAYDAFSASLQVRDVDRDGRADVIAGAPGENSSDGYFALLVSTTAGRPGPGSVGFVRTSFAGDVRSLGLSVG